MKNLRIHDKIFRQCISREEIEQAVDRVADEINRDYHATDTVPLFLGVLNGSFMFMAALMQRIKFPCEVSFIRVSSYDGTQSAGRITEVIGLTDDIRGRHVWVVEDIVDTGRTLEHLIDALRMREPASVEAVSLLFKPDACQVTIPVRYALAIPNDFIVGYGLDYNGLGRNLPDIYRLNDE